jgi:hypothetical protein
VRAVEIWRLGREPVRLACVNCELLEEYLGRRGDLGTNWLGRLTAALLTATTRGASLSFTAIDDGGVNRTIFAKMNVYGALFNSTYNYDTGCYIGIGTGTMQPSRRDYALQSMVARAPASASYIDDSEYVLLTAPYTLTTDAEITEVGLFWREGFNGWFVLLDRTLLPSAVKFPANTPMMVVYKIAV